jgi:hypothetical protein
LWTPASKSIRRLRRSASAMTGLAPIQAFNRHASSGVDAQVQPGHDGDKTDEHP